MDELVRIKRLEYFVDKFEEEVQMRGAETAAFSVSDAFIISLNLKDPPVDHDNPNMVLSNAYLVEPLRATTAVTKFSGTLGASQKTDKLSCTIQAFVHFIATRTGCKLVFADVQGSMDYLPGEVPKMVLFDPMTHSVEQCTGQGDFGAQGIQDYIDNHSCSSICKALVLNYNDLEVTLEERVAEYEDSLATQEVQEPAFTIVKAPNSEHVPGEAGGA